MAAPLVAHAALLELSGEPLGLLDRHRADQDRLALRTALGDVLDRRRELRLLGAVDEGAVVESCQGPVRRDRHDLQVVGAHELGGLCQRRSGHAGELVVHAEVVLEGDRRQGLVLLLDLHAFLGLDRLVKALGPAAAVEDAAGELVDDLHLAVGDQVVAVLAVQLLGLDRDLQLVHQAGGHVVVEVVDAE